MTEQTFQTRFGALLRRYVEAKGWTVEQVAWEVWGSRDRGTHVSAYVAGRKGRPSAPTVRKFCDALGISAEEIEACRAAPAPDLPTPDATQRAALGLGEQLIKALAWEFGHDNPKAGLDAWRTFLEQKAQEHTRLQAELAALKAADARLSNSLAEAQGLIDDGRFEEADAVLDAAKALARERTLESARQLAALTAAQGDVALLRQDAEAATELFLVAAEPLDGLDAVAAANLRFDHFERLWQHGLRYGGPAFLGAERLCRRALERLDKETHPEPWARAQLGIGIALSRQGQATEGDAGLDLLAQAAVAYETALTVWTEAEHPTGFGHAQNNLANALRNMGSRMQGEAGTALLGRAVAAYEAALRVLTETQDPAYWAATQNNLGNALRNQGTRTEGDEGTALLERSVGAYEAALRVRTEADRPVEWAMTQNNLGNALGNLGERTEGAEGLALYERAIAAWEAALRVHTERDWPVDWAQTTENIGIAREALAEREPEAARAHLEAALGCYEAALRVFEPVHLSFYYEKCIRARDRVTAKLKVPGEAPDPS